MTLGQQLYVILLLIYLSDCLWWIPHTGWFIQGSRPGKMKARFAGAVGNLRGGFVFLNPVPGWTLSFELRELPYSVSPKGWAAWVPQVLRPGGRADQDGRCHAFDKPGDPVKRHGAELWMPEGGQVDARGADAAEMDAADLCALKSVSASRRQERLAEIWRRQIDPDAVSARVEEVQQATRWLGFTGRLQWIALFLISPVWCLRFGLDFGILYSALLVFGLAVLNTVMFWSGHRRLYPLARGERGKWAFIMMLSFPMSARGADLLSRKALLRFQAPAVVAALAAPTPGNREVMQSWYRDVLYPLRIELEAGTAREIAETFISWRQQVWENWWRDLPDPQWREEEPLHDAAERKFCPRCRIDFDPEMGECPDCPGIVLTTMEAVRHV